MARLRPVGSWIGERFQVFAVHPGGMGVVYVAHDQTGASGRSTVAIKTLRDEWLADPDASARFAAEARIWVRLASHPHIVRAVAVEEFDGKPHIVLELITGGDLRRPIRTRAIDPPRAFHLGIQFCLGMEHAIRQGLRCHRDIKPGNLMLGVDGALKITDFGLAVIRDELHADGGTCPGGPGDGGPIPLADEPTVPMPIVFDDARDHLPILTVDPESTIRSRPGPPDGRTPEETARLTQTGSLLGTLPYMAPEQFRDSKAVDVRADIYAFGVVLFEMLTGQTPFHGATIARFDRAHTNYTPPSVVPAIPRRFVRHAEAIDEIVQTCLKKEVGGRYQKVDHLRRALTRTLHRLEPSFDPRTSIA